MVVVVIVIVVVVVIDRTRLLVKHRLPRRFEYDIERGERRAREEGAAAVEEAAAAAVASVLAVEETGRGSGCE